jgi:hypothetical protein
MQRRDRLRGREHRSRDEAAKRRDRAIWSYTEIPSETPPAKPQNSRDEIGLSRHSVNT